MSKFALILAVSIFLFPCFASGEAEYTLYKEILGHQITSTRQSFAVDKDGCLWVASGGLVFRHNGTDWEDFTEQSCGADYVSTSPDGALWFAAKGHFSKFDGVNWTSYSQNINFPDDYLKSISASSDSVVWFNFQSYIAKFDGKEIITIKTGFLQDSVHRIAAVSDGGVWLIYHNFFDEWDCFGNNCPIGTSYFDGENFHHFTAENGLPKSSWGNTSVEWITEFSKRGDIFASCNSSLMKYSNSTWSTVAQFPSGSILVSGYDGKLWCGYLGILNGCKLQYFKENKWVNYDVSELTSMIFKELNAPFSHSMAVTPDGKVWMGFNYGVIKINPDSLPLNNTSVIQSENQIPVNDKLSCYPNPFNSSATIKYYLDKNSPVTVEIYNSVGQKIRNVFSQNMKSGFNYANWNGMDDKGRRVSTGFYTVVVRFSDKLMSRKILFLK